MNPIQVRILEHVDGFKEELSPLADACRRYVKYCCSIDADASWHIAHRPWVAPLNYLITLYPSAKKSWFDKYKQIHNVAIPRVIQNVLLQSNGFFAFGMSFFGIPPTMLNDPPRLDRSKLNCHDISTANKAAGWKSEYAVDQAFFHFASRHFTENENIGYFLNKETDIYAFKKSGEQVGTWIGMRSFLESELRVSEERECSNKELGWFH